MSKIYIASTLNNPTHNTVVDALEKKGHEVYNYRNPPNRKILSKTDTDLLDFPARAAEVLASERTAISNADLMIAIYPFGLSVATEIGYAFGTRTKCIIYAPSTTLSFELWLIAIPIIHNLDELVEYTDNANTPPFKSDAE